MHKFDLAESARERELAEFDEKNQRAVELLNPMRDKNWRKEPRGRRDDTCDHGLSRSWKVDVCEEKKRRSIFSAGRGCDKRLIFFTALNGVPVH